MANIRNVFSQIKGRGPRGCLLQSLSAATSTTLGVFSSSTVLRGTYLAHPSPVCPTATGWWKEQRCHDPAGGSAGGQLRDRQLPASPSCLLTAHAGVRVLCMWICGNKGTGPSRNVAPGPLHAAAGLETGQDPENYSCIAFSVITVLLQPAWVTTGVRSLITALALTANPRNGENAHSWQAG